jgi:hypothetical protein
MKFCTGLRVFENRVPKRIYGPNAGKIMGDWRKLHSEERGALQIVLFTKCY